MKRMKNWVELNVIADEIADKIKSKVNQNKRPGLA